MPDNERDRIIDQVAHVLHDHRLAHDNTGGFRGVLGGWNRSCICGWHGVDQEVDDHAFEHHVADKLAGLLRSGGDTSDCDHDLARWPDDADHWGTGSWRRHAEYLRGRVHTHMHRAERAEAEVAKLRAERDRYERIAKLVVADRDRAVAETAALRARVKALHHPIPGWFEHHGDRCESCRTTYPCDTVRALDIADAQRTASDARKDSADV